MYEVEIFKPPSFQKAPLNLMQLKKRTGKEWQYASSGKSALYHILKAQKIHTILLPVYICQSVLEPIRKLNIKPLYYDIDPQDLNASVESIQYWVHKEKIEALLVASMYGNPADMTAIESLCKAKGIFLIDDAAQSFGAELDAKMIGTFGDAGFFSFAPGKPTAGHMGGFFWSSTPVFIQREKNCLFHYLKYKDFELNRLKIYDKKRIGIFYNVAVRIYNRFIDTCFDDICNFEVEILGGILDSLFKGDFDFRKSYSEKFYRSFSNNSLFRVLTSLRGNSSAHKIVLIFNKDQDLIAFEKHLKENAIFSMCGYKMLKDDPETLPNAKELSGKIIELSIENDPEKMAYLFEKVEIFVHNKN